MFERFDRDNRMLMAFATQEAADLGHRRLGNDHLVLGMLCNARTPLFEVLGAQGMTLAPARDTVRAYHEEHDTGDRFDDAADAGETAAQRYEDDRDALRSIGIDLDKVRAAVRDRFGDDLSEGWAQRPGRGRGRRGRGGPHDRHRGHRHGHGPHGHGPHAHGPRAHGPHAHGEFDSGPGEFGPGGFGPGGFGPEGAFGDSPFADGPFADGPWEPGRGRRGPRGRGPRARFTSDSRDALRAAMSIARERGDDRLRPEHLLLGILDVGDDASRAVIASATTADELKAAVLASLPEAQAGV